MSENPFPRSIWWGRADWIVFVPIFLFLASFWMYLSGRDFGPITDSIHQFYGARVTAEAHSLWVIAGSVIIFFHSFTLFLRRRLLFGVVGRRWTIAIAVLFILVSAFTGFAGFADYAASFL